MGVLESEKLTCKKCGNTMAPVQFYKRKNGDYDDICKKCLTMHVDNFNPDTYLWLLERADVPYLPEEWQNLLDKAYAKDPLKLNGMSVYGKYIAKMRLKQWKDYTWADTERLQALTAERQKINQQEKEENEAAIKAQYEAGEITEAEYRTLTSSQKQYENAMAGLGSNRPSPYANNLGDDNPFIESNFVDVNIPDNGFISSVIMLIYFPKIFF